MIPSPLPRGIVPVLQTPFDADDQVDLPSLGRLVDDAIAGGAAGFLAPAVASEVDHLTLEEREMIVRSVAHFVRGRVPYVVGASSINVEECRAGARLAEEVGAAAYLVAVPESFYQRPEDLPDFAASVAAGSRLPMLLQDLQWNGPGLPLEVLREIRERVPSLAGVKIETIPAGPKYSAVREAFGRQFYICGGWAVPQMIEALDRGVDAMVPEASMVRVYAAIYRLHASGRRWEALALFRRLVPVLAFSNQEIRTSIAFFKALLVRRGIFQTDRMRWPGFAWDAHNRRIAEELIDLYLGLEAEVGRALLSPDAGQEQHHLRHQGDEE